MIFSSCRLFINVLTRRLTMMRRSYVPVLLLATVAVSSSNVIPKVRDAEPLYPYGQPNDNIFNHRYQINNILNRLFCKQHISIDDNYSLYKFCKVLEINNDDLYGKLADDSSNDVVSKKDNHNGEGFRKEQWHNYPRQLDRLHRYFYEYDSEKNLLPDPGDPDEYNNEIPLNYKRNKDKINEPLEGTSSERQYDAIITTYPLIFKIISDPMKNEKYSDPCKPNNLVTLLDGQIECKIRKDNEVVQQKDISYTHNYVPNETNLTDDKGMKVDKRIFSLWSRLQSLSHKGHELPHRRHLHALYGLPDAEGGGALTAEPRDGLRRPPGAPLRWG